MIQFGEARQIASDMIEGIAAPEIADVVIDDSRTIETDTHWVFFYNTREYLETGAIIHALAGNAPIFVSKADGDAEVGRTDISIKRQLDERSRDDMER